MAFFNRGKESGTTFQAWSTGWHDGEYFDHSPSWSNSPVDPSRSKMVATAYNHGPHPRPTVSYATAEEAEKGNSKPHVYTWDGTSWTYHRHSPPGFKRGNVWSRQRRSGEDQG